MLFQNPLLGHSITQPSEDIPYGDTKTANARLPIAFARLDSNSGDRRWHEPIMPCASASAPAPAQSETILFIHQHARVYR
jgi:hypothetical protein